MAKREPEEKGLGKLFSFFTYSQFPFCHGGEVVSVRPNGNMELREYGHGYYFKSIHLLPFATGKELAKKLKDLEAEYRVAEKKFHEDWYKRAKDLAPFINKEK